ncbi:hypothetical protein Droror1_Dr00016478 [Drosera rotundifolia]
MGRSLSPVLCQELANLEKDAESRKSAMRALNSYVEGLDTKSIPQFLAQVSETKDAGFSSMEYTISLYEVLARVHGPKIVPQIDNIMATIIKTLATSGGSFAPQQACSKVILAMSRYAILPTTLDEKKTEIMHSLCKPLSEALLGTQECGVLSYGAALCLKAIVDCDNWRFASDEMVNVICLRLAGALEDKLMQTNSHMGLVMSLAKNNSIVIEPYARLLIQAGLRTLDSGDMSSPKRLTAIHMIGYLMKYLDIGSICSELGSIIDEMEKLLSDEVRCVSGSAYEALETARKLIEKSPRCDKDMISTTGSYFRNSGLRRRIPNEDKSPSSMSPESRTLGSFGGYGFSSESPPSESQVSCNFGDRKSGNRKLWSHQNGGVNISANGGLFTDIADGSEISHAFSEHDGASDCNESCTNRLAGLFHGISPKESLRSCSSSPQKVNSHINLDNVKIFTTPRKLVRSLQETELKSNAARNHGVKPRSSCSCKCKCDAMVNHHNHNGLSYETSDEEDKGSANSAGSKHSHSNSESVSSTKGTPVSTEEQVSSKMVPTCEIRPHAPVKSFGQKITCFLLQALLLGLFVACVLVLWTVQDVDNHLIPT